MAVILLLIGYNLALIESTKYFSAKCNSKTKIFRAFAIPSKETLPVNATDWERIIFQFEELAQNRGEDALSFILNVLTIIGTVTMVFYTVINIRTLNFLEKAEVSTKYF